MEFPAQNSRFPSSEDTSPSPATWIPTWETQPRHSTPEGQGAAPHWSPRPSGQSSYLAESPKSSSSSQDLVTRPVGVGLVARFRKRRLSTIQDSEGPSEQPQSCSDTTTPGDNSPASASSARPQHHAETQPRNSGLPGIPNTARRQRWSPKRRAAAMRRVQEWEARLLREIEAAVQHELTVEAEGGPGPGLAEFNKAAGDQEPDTSA